MPNSMSHCQGSNTSTKALIKIHNLARQTERHVVKGVQKIEGTLKCLIAIKYMENSTYKSPDNINPLSPNSSPINEYRIRKGRKTKHSTVLPAPSLLDPLKQCQTTSINAVYDNVYKHRPMPPTTMYTSLKQCNLRNHFQKTSHIKLFITINNN